MRYKDPVLKEQILTEINSFFFAHQRSPVLRELAETMGVAHTTIKRYLEEMQDEGVLEYSKARIMTDVIREHLGSTFSVLRLAGWVRCGDPQLETEQKGEYITIPSVLLGNGSYYVLFASGDSMHDAGIDEGDLLLIRQTAEASVGQIVVALDEAGQNTLKRYMYDAEQQRPYLHPENKKYNDLYPEEIIVQGVCERVIKDVR